MNWNKESRKITAKRVNQGNQDFLLGVFSIQQLLQFTKYTERIIEYFDDEGLPVYNRQIQRKTSAAKVRAISDFLIYDSEAILPTNLVVAIPEEAIDSIEEDKGQVEVILSSKVLSELENQNGDIYLTIIDGQHRLKGIERAIQILKEEYNNPKLIPHFSQEKSKQKLDQILRIELAVSFFVAPSLEYQATVFSTINRTQKKVSENLVYDLFGLTSKDSPQKTSLEVCLALNGHPKSPFYKRVRLSGSPTRKGFGVLSQATMVKSILFLISKRSNVENERRFERAELSNPDSEGLPFRKYYIENRDSVIGKILFTFFSSVRRTFVSPSGESYWEVNHNERPSNILQTTIGYEALLRLLVKILEEETNDEERQRIATYDSYLSKVKKVDFEDVGENKRYPFTSKSRTTFYDDLVAEIWR